MVIREIDEGMKPIHERSDQRIEPIFDVDRGLERWFSARSFFRYLNYRVGDDDVAEERAWGLPAYGLLFGSALIILHFVNYRVAENRAQFLFLLAVIPPLALGSLRANLNPPSNPWERTYAIVFDCLVKKSFLRNHVVLTLCILMVSCISEVGSRLTYISLGT